MTSAQFPTASRALAAWQLLRMLVSDARGALKPIGVGVSDRVGVDNRRRGKNGEGAPQQRLLGSFGGIECGKALPTAHTAVCGLLVLPEHP
jgi:hypothetical protein